MYGRDGPFSLFLLLNWDEVVVLTWKSGNLADMEFAGNRWRAESCFAEKGKKNKL